MGEKRSVISFAQFVIIIVVTVALLVSVDLGRKAMVYHRLQQEEADLWREVEAEKVRQQELEAFKRYVLSDEFVERWARDNARMARGGEVVVVPVFFSEE
ncbi:MAG: hypothetical protein U9R11_03860 [Chloroflexota bacterium]|nr:hypothetical protein [Chloroflexota bacterium]